MFGPTFIEEVAAATAAKVALDYVASHDDAGQFAVSSGADPRVAQLLASAAHAHRRGGAPGVRQETTRLGWLRFVTTFTRRVPGGILVGAVEGWVSQRVADRLADEIERLVNQMSNRPVFIVPGPAVQGVGLLSIPPPGVLNALGPGW